MDERRENTPQKIDLSSVLLDVVKGIKKLWWLVILLSLIFAFRSYLDVSTSYVPRYVASATMAIKSAGSDTDYVNAETAEQMANIFPYILKNGLLQDKIAEDLGMEGMPGSVSMTAEPGTNLFTISAQASDPEVAYQLLQATIERYPEVAEFIIGRIEMEILDETGVPEDTGREYTFRGSFMEGAVKGASLGILIMGLYVVTRNSVKTRKELNRLINLDDMGSIPFIPNKKRKGKKTNRAVNMKNARVPQVYLEAIRRLRIRVMKQMEKNNWKTLLITSSVPGEGKTTVSTNLAIALAKDGKKVALVDCDPRNPSVAKQLKIEEQFRGIGAVLRGEVSLKESLVTCSVDKEHEMLVLCASKSDAKAAALLGTEKMESLLKALKQCVDIVILDTAPAELLADASALARYVDAALYVVKQDYAKKGQIRNGVQTLSMSGIKILGLVFNADKSKHSGGYGYKKYSNYYGYGYYGKRKNDDMAGRIIKD